MKIHNNQTICYESATSVTKTQ